MMIDAAADLYAFRRAATLRFAPPRGLPSVTAEVALGPFTAPLWFSLDTFLAFAHYC